MINERDTGKERTKKASGYGSQAGLLLLKLLLYNLYLSQ